MDNCPICKTKIEKKKDYCPNCAWEFEYYFDELSIEEKERYKDRFKIWNGIYTKLTAFEKGLIASKVTTIKKFSFEPEMVHIKRGSFMMGSDENKDEKPIHQVTIDHDFEIGKYPVTFEEYDYYCDEVGIKKVNDKGWGRGKQPVINVSWHDAKNYTKWLSQKTGKNYRLPTEAEWEYVARAGTITKWSFGDNENDLKEYAWYYENSNDKTHQVGTKRANPWGVYDIYGNVWEWCEDWYLDSYNNTPKDSSANHYQNKNRKVLRGGSWYDNASLTRSTVRFRSIPAYRSGFVGFRLQRTLP